MAGVGLRAAGAQLVPGWARTALPVSLSSAIAWAREDLLSGKLSRQQSHRGLVPAGPESSLPFLQHQPGGSGFWRAASKGRRVPLPCGLARVWELPLRHWQGRALSIQASQVAA